MKCNQFFTVVKKAQGEKRASAAPEAGAYYYNTHHFRILAIVNYSKN